MSFLHLSNFALDLSWYSVADFLNAGARAPTSAERVPLFTCMKDNAV